jgi:hypothetical protein
MSSLRLRLKGCNEQIKQSKDIIEQYMGSDNILNSTSVDNIKTNLATLDPILLQGVCEHTINIVKEINLMARKEIQRRGLAAKQDAMTTRSAAKRRAWFSSSESDGSDSEVSRIKMIHSVRRKSGLEMK